MIRWQSTVLTIFASLGMIPAFGIIFLSIGTLGSYGPIFGIVAVFLIVCHAFIIAKKEGWIKFCKFLYIFASLGMAVFTYYVYDQVATKGDPSGSGLYYLATPVCALGFIYCIFMTYLLDHESSA